MNAHGYALERALTAQHDVYRAQGVADVRQVPTPVTVLGRTLLDKRGRACFRGVFAARTGVDFIGWAKLPHYPLPVCLEAKAHLGAESWSISSVSPDQAAQLDLAEHAGCIALVVLAAWGDVWALPWMALDLHRERVGRATLRAAEAGTVGYRCRGYDWLEWWR